MRASHWLKLMMKDPFGADLRIQKGKESVEGIGSHGNDGSSASS